MAMMPQNQIPCQKMDERFRSLASQYPHTRFMRISAHDLAAEGLFTDDADVLPTVVVYCAGETITSLPRVYGSLDHSDTSIDIEETLLK